MVVLGGVFKSPLLQVDELIEVLAHVLSQRLQRLRLPPRGLGLLAGHQRDVAAGQRGRCGKDKPPGHQTEDGRLAA